MLQYFMNSNQSLCIQMAYIKYLIGQQQTIEVDVIQMF